MPVQVWYTLARPRGSAFGERPLPGGTMQLYQADSAGRLQLIGEAATDHTAPGRDLRVQSGDAFDVTAERVQTDYRPGADRAESDAVFRCASASPPPIASPCGMRRLFP